MLAADAFCAPDTLVDSESIPLFVNAAAPQYGSAVAQAAALSGSGGSTGSISGYKWNDLDGDGTWDQPDEPGLGGWIIYLDDNENGSLDNGETFTVTAADGSYSFDGLAAGNYTVAEVMQPGWSQTSPDHFALNLMVNGDFETGTLAGWMTQNSGSGGFVINDGTVNPFGPDGPLPPYAGSYSALSAQTSSGTFVLYQDVILPSQGSLTLRWADQIRNHYVQFVEGSQEYRVEIRNTSNQVLDTVFSTNPGDVFLQPWTERSVDLTEYGGQTIRIAFVEQNSPTVFNVHLDNVRLMAEVLVEPIDVTLADGEAVSGVNFGNWIEPPGEIRGYKWNDLDGDGTWDQPEEPPLEGWTIYLDANANGGLDAGEFWTETGADGSYSFTGLPAGEYLVGELLQPGWMQTSPGPDDTSGLIVNGGFETGNLNGWTSQVVTSGGFIIGNSSYVPPGEQASPPYQGTYSAYTASSGANHHAIYQEVTIPLGGAPTLRWADRVRNFASSYQDPFQEYRVEIRNTADQLLATVFSTNPGDSSQLPWTEREADLSAFAGQTVRIAFVKQNQLSTLNVALDNVRIMNDGGVGQIAVTVAPGEVVENVNFGNRQQFAAEIHGYKWNDLNGNGVWEQPDEPALVGVVIYLDANSNGTLDTAERWTTTATDGSYSFTGLPAGDYTVAEVVTAGWTRTSPGESLVSAERLFAMRTGTDGLHTLYEIDPLSGQILNSFLSPTVGGASTVFGLALGESSLFVLEGNGNSISHRLWEINPDTGAIIDSDLVSGTSASSVGGMAYLDGKIYLERSTTNQLLVWDPVTDTVVTTISTTVDLNGGLTGAADLGVLFATNGSGSVYKINPATGALLATYAAGVGPLAGGVAYVNGELIVSGSFSQSPNTAYRLNAANGQLLGSFNLGPTGATGGLAGDGATLKQVSGVHVVSLETNEVATDVNFGNWIEPTGSIQGISWNDLNGDTFLGIDEPVNQGRVVYLDTNRNGALDGGEQWTVTGSDGSFSFEDLPSGEYAVAELLPAGWTGSYPTDTPPQLERLFSAQYLSSMTRIFELDPATGAVINNFPAPTTWQSTLGLAVGPNSLFFLDDINTFPGGTRRLWELDLDTGAVIDSDVIDFNWNGALAYLDGHVYIRNGVDDVIIAWDPATDTVVKTLNMNGVAIFSGMAAAPDLGLLFVAGIDRIYAVEPRSGGIIKTFIYSSWFDGLAYVRGELIGVMQNGTAHRINPLTGAIIGPFTLPNFGTAEALGGDGVGSLSAGSHLVELSPGYHASEVDFASWVAPPTEIHGTVWNDADNDDTWDQPDEPGLEGWTVYLDANFNNVLDVGEISTTSGPDGSYTLTGAAPGYYRVRQVLQNGWSPTFAPPILSIGIGETISDVNFGNYPQSGYISGQKWHDVDGDGVKDSGEPGLNGWTIFIDENANGVLDENEHSTETFSNGYYSFFVRPGEYTLAEIQQDGWVSTYTPGVITMDPGGDVDDVDFGNQALPGSIQGVKFHDLDGDRTRDEDEPGLAGWTIFLDANENGVLDAGEQWTVTDANGEYEFIGVAYGEYFVREVELPGWIATTPKTFDLSQLLAELNDNHAAISSLVPNRFNFSEGQMGDRIQDGGNDMYDDGNYISNGVQYTNGQISDVPWFGTESRYFTAKYTGLFVLAADKLTESFDVGGLTGIEEGGTVEAEIFSTTVDGRLYTIYTRRVFGAPNPSVNQLIITPGDGSGVVHFSSPYAYEDGHGIYDLESADQLYFLLFSSANGGYVSDGDMVTIANAFLANVAAAHVSGPARTSVPPGQDVTGVDFGNFAVQPLIGDYNRDESVDAADYVMWRKLLGAEVPTYEAADGDGDEVVGGGDHGVWASQFGSTSSGSGGAGAATVEQLLSESPALVAGALAVKSGQQGERSQAPIVDGLNLDFVRTTIGVAPMRRDIRAVASGSGDGRREAALMAYLAAHVDQTAITCINSLAIGRHADAGEVDDDFMDGVFADLGREADWFSRPGGRRAPSVPR